MTPDDGTPDRSAELRHTNGPMAVAASQMKATIIADSAEDIDEEMEKRLGPKRCRSCG